MILQINSILWGALLAASLQGQAVAGSTDSALPEKVPAPTLIIKDDNQPVIHLAQSADATFRINELEEQVRKLNGKVEELTFQLLELQETIRKMQQDNELRFQELEDQQQGSLSAPPKKQTARTAKPKVESLGKSEASGTSSVSGANPRVITDNSNKKTSTELAAPSRSLGTIKFDESGNVIDSGPAPRDNSLAKPGTLPPGVFDDGTEGAIEAAEFGPTPDSVLAVGIKALEGNRFARASSAFKAHLKAWPKDPRSGEVRYHLGQVMFMKKDYYNAANMFLDTHNSYPDARTGADNLLSLGLSLAGLNQREVACATYAEVLKQYPADRDRMKARVTAEQASARC